MNRLKEVRKERNLTQEELSEIVGVERRTIGYWENGKSSIKPKQARKKHKSILLIDSICLFANEPIC